MNVLFIASVSLIVRDVSANRELFVDGLGLPLHANDGDEYLHSEKIAGTKHFGLWPLAQAATACFGAPEWPVELTVPQTSVEFEVEDADAVATAAAELEARGFTLLHDARLEPWGQTVARLLSPEGAIIGLSFAAWLHEEE
jgi:catechol 2,3-dioxygenase-like lactoylglutathione lyase family enzyme